MSHAQPPSDVPDEPQIEDEPTLADSDETQGERGRIGYGRHERMSSWLLGAVLVAIVAGIGVYQLMSNRGNDDEFNPAREVELAAIGQEAPDFTLQTFDGNSVTLSQQRGKVVVLNFWGSWCEPCKREMPAFQKYWSTAPEDVVFIGVGAKQDQEDKSRAFAREFGVTYPIGRDSEGSGVSTGDIAKSYNVSFYPMTYIINPEGKISSLVVGELDEDGLQSYIDKARDDVSGYRVPAEFAIWGQRVG